MIRDFIIGESALPISAETRGKEEQHCDSLYLLNEEGTVLSCRAKRKIPATGVNFFKELGTARPELEALYRTLRAGEEKLYLMQCGPVPVLVIRYFWRGNRTLLAVIPEEGLARDLRTPAAYAEVLFPRELNFSPLSCAKRMPADPAIYRAAQDWIAPYIRVGVQNEMPDKDAIALMQQLNYQTACLARLCGVTALYHYSDIGYGTVKSINHPLLITDLAAVMLAAHRVGEEQTLYLTVEREEGGAPTVYARIYLAEDLLPLPELVMPQQVAREQGGEFLIFGDPTQKQLHHVRFSFCTPRLERLELHPYLPYRP